MPYRCLSPEAYDGKVVGTGQCVAFVQRCAGAPVTAGWRKGTAVKGNMNISRGTAIATFDASGRYPNRSTGNHAAIYISQDRVESMCMTSGPKKGMSVKITSASKVRAGFPATMATIIT